VDGTACMLDILDTAGQEEYSSMRDQYMQSGQGFVLVYSVTAPSSFDDIKGFRDQILKVKEAEKVRYDSIVSLRCFYSARTDVWVECTNGTCW